MGLSDELNKFIPKDFGKKKKKQLIDATAIDNPSTGSNLSTRQNLIKPADDSASNTNSVNTDTSNKSKRADETTQDIYKEKNDNEQDNDAEFPISCHIAMKGHKKAVSTIAWDPTGDLLASGEHGPRMMLWDFVHMDSSFESFRTVEPYENQHIHMAKFNRTGDMLLCATSDPRAKLFGPDGRTIREFKRGDMYVMDMRRTKGHVAALTALDWCPISDSNFITSSADSTVRVWNCERPMSQDQVIVAKTKTRGTRIAVTACAYSNDGNIIASAQQDGGLLVWPTKGPFTRPASHVENAHVQGTETSCIAFAPNGQHMATRGGDDTVKLWDIRQLKAPLATAYSLPSAGPEANLAFSPSACHILVGVARSRRASADLAKGTIAVLDSGDLSVSRSIDMPFSGDVVNLAASSTDGSIAIMYSPHSSIRGAIQCVARRRSRRHADHTSTDPAGPIITPHALPLFREDKPTFSTKRRRDKVRDDPLLSNKPAMPIYGHGKGGAIGVNETQHIMKSIIKDTIRDEDPREALLKYATVAESDPKFIAPAYKDSQSKPVFDETSTDDLPAMKRRK
ncbi:WD40-repeat-containing domain protein [Coemansia spiralis]|nr:WD40-repeat-containing domain protein [Coemansia spiralis]